MRNINPGGDSIRKGASITDKGNLIKVSRRIWITLPVSRLNQEEILSK